LRRDSAVDARYIKPASRRITFKFAPENLTGKVEGVCSDRRPGSAGVASVTPKASVGAVHRSGEARQHALPTAAGRAPRGRDLHRTCAGGACHPQGTAAQVAITNYINPSDELLPLAVAVASQIFFQRRMYASFHSGHKRGVIAVSNRYFPRRFAALSRAAPIN